MAESGDVLPGIEVVVETRREYKPGPLFAQILGYTGPIDADTLADVRDDGYLPDDMIGKTGIESVFEDELRGTYGAQLVERDATGRRVQVLSTVDEAVPGSSLRLTSTRSSRSRQSKHCGGGCARRASSAVSIAMNPQTGEVLALVNLPTYDNNLFATGISNTDFQELLTDPDKPLTDHAVQAHYPPGSTYKLVTGTGALAEGEIQGVRACSRAPT